MRDLLFKLKVLRRVGVLRVGLPHRALKAGLALASWGPGFPSGVAAAAARQPNQLAIIDDAGELTWGELKEQVDRFTTALKARGLVAGDSVGLLCRNHRYMIIAMIAVMQVGGRMLLLNTMASGQQLKELANREDAQAVMIDDEFVPMALDAGFESNDLILAWREAELPEGATDMATEIASSDAGTHKKPERSGSIVIFTSGTTGLPKGARRKEPEDLGPLVSFFGAIPYESNSVVVLSAPLFHSWGLLNFGFGLSTTPTYVLRRRFKPEQVLRDVEQYRANVLIVVPLMIQRLVDADPAVIEAADVSSLQITASSGAALPGELALHFQDTFTDSIYNFYGATETGWVTIANPQHVRQSPGTAGAPPFQTVVKILDEGGNEVKTGETGVIHVHNEMMFGGYTDGNSKQFVNNLMNTGDLGYFDENGLLFVSGRADDMIISGGENVFPRELEDALIEHPDVTDVVVTGAPDREWGQRLIAYVVRETGSTVTADALIAHARSTVARFAVPRDVVFLDELPRNPTGKVMKRELPPID